MFRICSCMRLSAYPYVTVRIACSRCSRKGSYRLARLADKYGSEIELTRLLDMLAGDCKLHDVNRLNLYDRCGAHFVDLNRSREPDAPPKQTHEKVSPSGGRT